MLDTNLVVRKIYFWKAFHSLSNKIIYFCKDSSKVNPSGGWVGGGWTY